MIEKNNYNLEHKQGLRRALLAKRASLNKVSYNQSSAKIIQHLKLWITNNEIKKIFLFYPFRNEPDIILIVKELKKKYELALPVILPGTKMTFQKWRAHPNQLHENKYNIKEPRHSNELSLQPDNSTLVCIPSIAIDLQGNRLGYGKGYYDRYLRNAPAVQHMVILFDDFIVDNIPKDPWDYPIKQICTESGVKKLS